MAEIDKISSASFAAADALAKLLITPARVVAQYGAEIVHHLRLGIRLYFLGRKRMALQTSSTAIWRTP